MPRPDRYWAKYAALVSTIWPSSSSVPTDMIWALTRTSSAAWTGQARRGAARPTAFYLGCGQPTRFLPNGGLLVSHQWFEQDEECAVLDGVAIRGPDFADSAGLCGTQLILHLHCFENGDECVALDGVADGDAHRQDT